MYKNKVLNHMSTRLPKFFSVHELKIKYISHKRTLWIEEPEQKFQKEGIKEDSRKDKSLKAQKCKMAWE